MKTSKLLIWLLLAPAPVLLADSATDRRIEDAARSSYNYVTVLQNHVKVHARDGVVTLSGTVSDPDQKTLAENTAAGLPGVVRVDNQISVQAAAPEHSDDWIAFKIRTTLLMKGNVSARATNVDVKDGVVTLTGDATSLAQKELTESYVKDIEGVKAVQNNLTVPVVAKRSFGEVVDDASITAQVKYALLTHQSTSALKTDVDTKDGAVVVTGEAGSPAERDLITQLAKTTRGVKSVDNQMTVKNN